MSKLRKITGLAALVALGGLLSWAAQATPPNTLFGSVAVCSPWNPSRCSIPDASGKPPVTATADNAPASPYPAGASVLTTSSGNVANASASSSMTGMASKTTYITGFQITAGGATVGSCVTATLTGTLNTLYYTFCAPTGAALAATPLVVKFDPPVPASAANTSIVLTLPALGTGNTNAAVSLQGYRL